MITITKYCLRFMHALVLILSLGLLWLKTTTGHKLIVGNGIMNACVDKEIFALLDFKAHLEDSKDFLSTWRAEGNECCKWSGITCNNQRGHVTKLDLSYAFSKHRLGGKVSSSLLKLTYLNHLDLSGNYFQGTIPRSIGSLTRLRYLSLHGNDFCGTIPKSIGSLIKLRYLDLSLNSLNGNIPSELGNLVNLQELSLGSLGRRCTIENIDWLSNISHLNYLVMDEISLANANRWVNIILSLKKLSYLSLCGCDLSQVMHPYSPSFLNSSSSSSIASLFLGRNNLNLSMYDWLFPLTSNRLAELDLSGNKLDVVPKYLGNLCSLTYLDFNNNSIVHTFSEFLNNLSGCTSVTLQALYAQGNQITGSLSNEIRTFSSLNYLYLSHNLLIGTISEKVWELPFLVQLDISSNYLRGNISENTGKSKLQRINLSNNSLEVVYISKFSYVEEIDLSSCKLGPRFPIWIQTLKSITVLNFANTRISDTIPLEFWNAWTSQLTYLNLSCNNIGGEIPDLFSNFDLHSTIDLSSNNFSGPIPNVPSTLEILNLSRNKFHGGISFLCQIVDGFLSFLDLSDNSFTGKIPDCLGSFKQLRFLNLGNNNLSGRLPASIESLAGLYMLNLCNNSLSGEVPSSLRNLTKLTFLDLGANRFSGNIPSWIGENLPRLYVICLTSNKFFGPIPLQLCRLVNLQLLDLSMNNLNGTIPTCIGNLTSMAQKGFSLDGNRLLFPVHEPTYGRYNEYVGHAMIKWQGNVREFSKTLRFVKSIDLSSNNLTGKIPYELANLYQLLQLNLSTNALEGEIPRNTGQMKELLTLDLSNNNLSGRLPSSLSEMTSLNYLDVSNNNLSGRIPSSTQLQSFEPSRYTGNAGICGPPVTKYCSRDEELQELQVPPIIGESVGGREGVDEFWRWIYIGVGTGFASGFWIASFTLLLNRRIRHVFFSFVFRLKDWVYIKTMVFIAKSQRVAHA